MLPEQGDLLAQSATDVAILFGRQVKVVQPLDQSLDATQGDEGGPAARLGRVRREHGLDRQPGQELVRVGTGRRQAQDGLADRATSDRTARRTSSAPDAAHPGALLGHVDELEIEGEGADDGFRVVDREPVELRRQLDAESGPDLRVVGRPQGDGPPPDGLDLAEEDRSGLFDDDLAEQCAEQLDLARQRVAGTGRADRTRLCADGRVRRAASVSSHDAHGAARRSPLRNRGETVAATFGPRPFS